MLAKPVARSFDLNDTGVVKQAIEKRGGDHRIPEDIAPLSEATVRGQDHRTALVAGVDELEEQVAPAGDDREVADLVDDEQGRAAEEADSLPELALPFRLGEHRDDISQCREVDTAPSLYGLDAERDGE